MIIVTDILIITLPYLPLVLRRLNSLPNFIYLKKYNLYPMLCLKIAGWAANSIDLDKTPQCGVSSGSTLFAQACLAKYFVKV